MEQVLDGLRAAAEPTRLRMLALCADAELTVTDLTQILGQSQPRVSRHLKLLCDAGLLDRSREGTWAFYRLARRGKGADLAATLIGLLPDTDAVLTRDRVRLSHVRDARADHAASYFRDNAEQWSRIRSLHVDDGEVEHRLLSLIGERAIGDYLDIGTGTGRMLELIGPRCQRGLGVDLSREMLALARANLERAGLKNCSVRQADLYQLPVEAGSCDLVTMHQVLHFLETPNLAVAAAAQALSPGGRLLVVDFAAHDHEELRRDYAHRRLGFAADELATWCQASGLAVDPAVTLPGDPLTVVIWSAHRPRSSVPSAPFPIDAARQTESVS